MSEDEAPDLRTDVPHGARIWNYWLGGKDNFPADRAVGDAVRDAYPAVAEYAVKSRQFLVRAVRHLAGEAGLTQFLDVGTGLPTMQNTHEVAQALQPAARVVYVDNDPMVLTHARALLTSTSAEGTTTYVDADYTEPERILAEARTALDFDRPVAVLFMGVFGYLERADEAHAVIRALMDAVPPGSHMALWDATATTEEARLAAKAQADAGSPYATRTVAEIEGWFAGLELVEPGVVPITFWRPDPVDVGKPEFIEAYGGIGRKP